MSEIFEKLFEFLEDQSETIEISEYEDIDKKERLLYNALLEFDQYFTLSMDTNATDFFRDRLRKINSWFWFDKNRHVSPEPIDVTNDWSLISDDNRQIEIFKSFFSKDYYPPLNHVELNFHLRAAWIFYAYIVVDTTGADNIKQSIKTRMDLVTIQLIAQMVWVIGQIERIGNKNDRILSMKKGKAQKLERKAQAVIEEYYRVDTKDMKFHKIATTIFKKLHEKGKDEKSKNIPSIDTIKRWLRRDPQIRKDLEKKKSI